MSAGCYRTTKENALTVVHRFVDRDMVMRYFGGGVGHLDQIQRQHEGMAREAAESSEDEDEMETSEPGLEVEGIGSQYEPPNAQSQPVEPITSQGQADGMDSEEEEEEEEGITDDEGRVSEGSEVSDYAGDDDDDDDGRYASD